MMLRSLGLLTSNAIVAFSEQCVAKLVREVLLLYSVVSSRTLAIGTCSCKSEKRAIELHLAVSCSHYFYGL